MDLVVTNILCTFAGRNKIHIRMDIKKKILQHGMTPSQVAEKMGIKAPTLSKMLKNQSGIKLSSVERIADAIGCTASELLSDETSTFTCPKCGTKFTIEVKPDK